MSACPLLTVHHATTPHKSSYTSQENLPSPSSQCPKSSRYGHLWRDASARVFLTHTLTASAAVPSPLHTVWAESGMMGNEKLLGRF